MLRGWGNYFKSGNSDDMFNQIDSYVWKRVSHWQWRRGGQRTRYRIERWPSQRLWDIGLYRLRGTVAYPVNATPRSSPVSRMREIRTHGLKGGAGNGPPQAAPRQ